MLNELGVGDIMDTIKMKLHEDQKIGKISIMFSGGRGGDTKNQDFHIDYKIDNEKYRWKRSLPRVMPFTFHIPLTSEGSHLYVLGITEPIYLKFGDILVVRGDVMHKGGIYKCNEPSYRMHIYVDTIVYEEPGENIYL